MPPQVHYEADEIYHIYNHANGRENVFESEENYYYFLKKYAEKLDGVVETLAYCLMPNHFHLLIKVKSKQSLEEFIARKTLKMRKSAIPATVNASERYHFIVHRQFHNFLGGYAKAFNKYHNRKGSLLRQNTRRKIVDNYAYLINGITYVHLNPVYHEFVVAPEEWQHSSYNAYLSNKPTRLPRTYMMELFQGKANFEKEHLSRIQNTLVDQWEC